MIRLLLSLFLVLAIGMGIGYIIGKDNGQKQCPSNALSQSNNTDGSVECVLKNDRDPAKTTRKEKR